MITNIRLELSDSDRNDLARRLDRTDTARLVTRKEIIELVHVAIENEIKYGQDADSPESGTVDHLLKEGYAYDHKKSEEVHRDPLGVRRPNCKIDPKPERTGDFTPSRGDEDYLAQPTDPGLAAACSRILDDTTLTQDFAWDTIERNRNQVV